MLKQKIGELDQLYDRAETIQKVVEELDLEPFLDNESTAALRDLSVKLVGSRHLDLFDLGAFIVRNGSEKSQEYFGRVILNVSLDQRGVTLISHILSENDVWSDSWVEHIILTLAYKDRIVHDNMSRFLQRTSTSAFGDIWDYVVSSTNVLSFGGNISEVVAVLEREGRKVRAVWKENPSGNRGAIYRNYLRYMDVKDILYDIKGYDRRGL